MCRVCLLRSIDLRIFEEGDGRWESYGTKKNEENEEMLA